MVTTDTLEGMVSDGLWFHFDLANDVLYLRMAGRREEATIAEETADGMLVLRAELDGQAIGLTVVDFWKRLGTGAPPISAIGEVEKRISEVAERLAA